MELYVRQEIMEDQPPFDEAFSKCMEWWKSEGKSQRVRWMFRDRIATYKWTTWFIDETCDADIDIHAEYYEAARAERLNIEFHYYAEYNGTGLIGVEVPERLLPEVHRNHNAYLNYKTYLDTRRVYKPTSSLCRIRMTKLYTHYFWKGRVNIGEALPEKLV
ncbi:hypothetical protein JIN77_16685 [Verrucomicrobiaceae bacterium R5-34]|nr:hypothetical protein [Verrucomicrobiaceae bacterium R5-34]